MSDELKEKIRLDPKEAKNPLNYPVGVHCFDNFFSHEELTELEEHVE